jgi:outer membrane immunogenic protein
MRRWFVAFCLLGVAPHAAAQDFDTPTLRGSSPFIPAPPKYTPWSGFYVGGQVGYAFSNMDATNAFESVNIFDPNNPLTAPLGSVSTWTALGRKDVRAASYGGFVGYNTQWDDAIIGIELNTIIVRCSAVGAAAAVMTKPIWHALAQ